MLGEVICIVHTSSKSLQRSSELTMFRWIPFGQYYEYYLNPFIYHYNVTYPDGTTEDLELRFDHENFCHLFGMESIVKSPYNLLI